MHRLPTELQLAGGRTRSIRRPSAILFAVCLLCAYCNSAHPEWEDGTLLGLLPTAAAGAGAGAGAATTKKVFVSTTTLAGHMGGATGVAAADAACMADGSYPGTGTYKALIVDGVARVACTTAGCSGGTAEHTAWVLQPSTKYLRLSDSAAIMTTNANGIFVFGTLTNSFDAGAGVNYWTGLQNNWTLSPKHCTAWTNGVGGGPNTGQSGLSNATNQQAVAAPVFIDCGTLTRLLCVEQ